MTPRPSDGSLESESQPADPVTSRASVSNAPMPSMFGTAAASLGAGVLQRKLARRMVQRKAGAAATGDQAKAPEGDKESAAPDFEKEWASLKFKDAIEGGFEGFKGVREALLEKFGTLPKANTYYAGVTGSPFLGKSPQVHKASLGAKLAAANKLLKDKGWYDAIVAESPSAGGFNVRHNRNNPNALSDHSFGWAIDIDAALNPNIKQFPAAVLRGLAGEKQGVFGGEANAKMSAGGTAEELLPWAEKMRDASDEFKAAFENADSLKKAMLDYLTGPLGMTLAAKDLDLEVVKGAKAAGGKAQAKVFQQLVDTLAGAHPNLAKALAEQLDEEQEAYVHQHGWSAWKKEHDKRDAAKKKADEKHEHDLADKWKKAGKVPTAQDLLDEAAKVTAGVEHDVAVKAAGFLVQMYDIYRQSFSNMKQGTRTAAQTAGTAGTIAAHGFINLKPELIAAMTGSDGGNLDWLGNASSTKDFMHFQLKPGDRPSLT